jgi:alpha-2-macroglobulin
MQFFAEFIPSDKTKIDYEMLVRQEGRFSTGMASLQCMYNPAVMAYSNSEEVLSK